MFKESRLPWLNVGEVQDYLEYLEVPESKKVFKNNLTGPHQRDTGTNLTRVLNGQSRNNTINNRVVGYNREYKINIYNSTLIK